MSTADLDAADRARKLTPQSSQKEEALGLLEELKRQLVRIGEALKPQLSDAAFASLESRLEAAEAMEFEGDERFTAALRILVDREVKIRALFNIGLKAGAA